MTIKTYTIDLNKAQKLRIGKPWSQQKRQAGKGRGKIGKEKPLEEVALSKFKATDNPEFNNYVKNVLTNISKEYPDLVKQAEGIEGVKPVKAQISGSYARGEPREDSDIDIKIYYKGDADPEELARELAPLHGKFGDYDVHLERITDDED